VAHNVAQYVVTPEDRAWFERCRRAWDLGALGRQGLELATPAVEPAGAVPALRDALAVHYFPGMWAWERSIVEPLVLAAFDRRHGPDRARSVLERFQQWALDHDLFTPLRVEVDVDVRVPDPTRADEELVARRGRAVHYRDRIDAVVADDDDRHWIGQHRVVAAFAPEDELVLDERGVLACWAWERFQLAETVEGTMYTELQLDPPAFRRTTIARTRAEKDDAAARLGWAVLEMLHPDLVIQPTPAWTHCATCAFRTPCIAMNRGGPAEALLRVGYRERPPDVLEEGRLGGVSWGLGRGAAPPRL
jgi:hypothetical protein